MQKSKKMMVSLCGLALSSLFVLNNKAVVHADVVTDGGQNNAISWDSDSDDSQVVNNTQTKTEQSMPQKADDHQQNVQSVNTNHAEIATVSSSLEITNRTDAKTAQNTPVQAEQKVANVQDAQMPTSVVINNPQDGKVNVHYVNSDGTSINEPGYTIGVESAYQSTYNVPKGYQLFHPDGKFNVTEHAYDGPNNVKVTGGSVEHVKATGDDVHHMEKLKQSNMIHVKFVDETTGKDVGGSYDINLANAKSDIYNVPKGYMADNNSYSISTKDKLFGADHDQGYLIPVEDEFPADITAGLKAAYANALKQWVALGNERSDLDDTYFGVDYAGFYKHEPYDDFDFPGLHLPDSTSIDNASDDTLVMFIMADNSRLGYTDSRAAAGEVVFPLPSDLQKSSVLGKFLDEHGDWARNGEPLSKHLLMWNNGFHTIPVATFTDLKNGVSGNTVTVPVHKANSFAFNDNSGNVRSVSGNNVNVILTKPQSVNPATDTRCQAQATRTIQINFPDGQIPKSYDGIVDKSGKLVQTVHFTRTATEDALTGNILQYGNWTSDNQDHNFIGFEARTLPRIPGYTLSIKPA